MKMKAIVCNKYGALTDLAVQQVQIPAMAPGQIRIQVETIGVNFPDALLVKGLYQAKPEVPFIPGLECAGMIEAVGEGVDHLAIGQRVAAMSPDFGTYAEYVSVPASHAYPVPTSVDISDAGAMLCAYGTAYHALVQRASLKAGESLLVMGAAGGTGLAAVQLGRALGAHVIAVCSNAEKLLTAKQYGADVGIDLSKEELRDALRSLTDGAGADVIFDPVGGNHAKTLSRSLAWNGRWLIIGFAAGEVPTLTLNIPLVKGYSAVGVFWGNFCAKEPHLASKNHQQIFEMVANGLLAPHIHAECRLDDAVQALKLIEQRQVHGKIILKP
ncbi:MAG: NADPH:quinone oxidoreductase family protein [Arenicellales bacterium]|nr:NADPH:quinone oxidoreductase family protein [Arenicellales bacterium]